MAWLVIWHNNTSSPVRAAMTNAGRFFEALKSEKGKGTTTTSPFTNLPMRCPLQDDPNRGAKQTRTPTWSDRPSRPFLLARVLLPALSDKKQNHRPPRVCRGA